MISMLEIPILAGISFITWRLLVVEKRVNRIEEHLREPLVTFTPPNAEDIKNAREVMRADILENLKREAEESLKLEKDNLTSY